MKRIWCATPLVVLISGFLAHTGCLGGAEVPPPGSGLFGDESLEFGPKSSATADVTATRHGQILIFRDGRQFHGELVALDDEFIVWRRPETPALFRIPRREVRRFQLSSAEANPNSPFPSLDGTAQPPPSLFSRDTDRVKPDSVTAVPATVKLSGADWLFGKITSADGLNFNLQLNDEVRLPISRAQIEWLYFAAEPAPAGGFSGSPLDLAPWERLASGVEVKDGTATITGQNCIGRAIHAPQRFEVAFELPSGSEDGMHLWLQSIGPTANYVGPGAVELRLSGEAIAQKSSMNDEKFETSPFPEMAIAEKGPLRYCVFYDGAAGRVCVWRNERKVGDWKMEGANAVQGLAAAGNPAGGKANAAEPSARVIRGVCFDGNGDPWQGPGAANSPPLKFNRICIQPWDGALPGQAIPDHRHDLLCQEDQEALPGTLEAIDNKSVVYSKTTRTITPGTFIELPNHPQALAAPEARLQLRGQGEFNAKHLEVREGRARCETAFAAAFEVPVAELECIDFPMEPRENAPAESLLVFKNGDEIGGRVLSATFSEGVRWQTTTGQQLEFDVASVAGFRSNAPGETPPRSRAAAVELRNGERLQGKLVAFDEMELRLQHDSLGAITLRRPQVARLYPGSEAVILDGAEQPDEWMRDIDVVSGRPAANRKPNPLGRWTCLGGIFALRPAVEPVPLELPDQVPGLQRQVDGRWQHFEYRVDFNTSNWSVLLYKDGFMSATVYASDGVYSVGVDNVHDHSYGAGFRLEGEPPEAKDRQNLRLFVDAETGSFDVLVNGASLGHYQWDRDDAAHASSKFSVRTMPNPLGNAPAVVSGTWLGPWSAEMPGSAPATGGVFTLNNGDTKDATSLLWHDGHWKLETDLGTIEVPTDRIVAIDFNQNLRPERAPGRIRLRDGTLLNVSAVQWKDGAVTAQSETLGVLHLPAEAVAELMFSPASWRPPMVSPSTKVTRVGKTEQ